MLDCTLDQVIEEIPGEMTGIEEVENKPSPTSPAEGAGEHTSVVEESTVGPSGEVTMPIAAVTESSAVPVPRRRLKYLKNRIDICVKPVRVLDSALKT